MLSSSTFGQIKFLSSRVDGVDHDDNDGKIDDEERYTRPTNNGHFRDPRLFAEFYTATSSIKRQIARAIPTLVGLN